MSGEYNCNEVIDIINILSKHNTGNKLNLEYMIMCLNRYEDVARELSYNDDEIKSWHIIGEILYHISNFYLGYKSKYDKEKYKLDLMFKDLYILEENLCKIELDTDFDEKIINEFIRNLKIFNKEELVLKRINISRFYADNIKNSNEVNKILNRYLKYKTIYEEIEIHKREFYLFVDMWKNYKIKDVLKYDTELYFRLIRIFEKLDNLKEQEFNKDNLKKQILIMDKELYPLLDKYLNNK